MPLPTIPKKLKLISSMKTRRPSRTNPKKRCPFHHWGLECKSRKSRDTWSSRRVWPWRTKGSRAKAAWILPREFIGHSKYPFSTTQQMTLHMDIIKWPILISNWLHSLKRRWRNCIQSAKTRSGADCGTDHQLLISKFRLKSRKQGKTTRPARYDANQSPYGSLVSSDSKASACNAGDLGSIPGLGKSLGEGNGNPLQYSCLENPMDGGAS